MSDEKRTTAAAGAKGPAFEFEPQQLAALGGTAYELIRLHVPSALDARGRPMGKAPFKGWRDEPAMTAEEAAEHMASSNVGVRLAADDLVVDVDPRNFAEGDDPLARLRSDLGITLDGYPTVKTGSGGLHVYMKVPAGTLVRDTLEAYPGVEFKGHGRQVVAPGSVHPETRKAYRRTSGDFAVVPQAPTALVEAVRRPVRPESEGAGDYSPDWLAGALELLDPTDFREHGRWLELMMACHHATDGDGREEFLDWSTSDPDYADHREAVGRRWDSLHSDQGGRQITVRTLFRELNRAGAGAEFSRAPDASRVAEDFPDDLGGADDDARSHLSLEDFVGSTEFVVDGFLPTGVGVIAGAWGAGKTINLIPLLATAAHVTPKAWTVGHSELRRHVVFVGEDMGQVRSAIGALSSNPGAASLPEILEWVHFFPARRLAPEALAARVKNLGDRFTYENEHGFKVRPVVVLDTANANCELESENDSRAVGQMMSALKGTGVPTMIVGHVAKAITRSEFAAHSFRGSGAFEADADFTAYLLHDEATDDRYLGVHKVRFAPEFREVAFGTYSRTVAVPVDWDPNKRQERTILNGVPTVSSQADRKERAAARRLEGKEKRVDDAVTALIQSGEHPTVKAVKEHLGRGNNQETGRIINDLCDRGYLVKFEAKDDLSKEDRQALDLHHNSQLLLPQELLLETYVSVRLGKLPVDEFDLLEVDPLDERAS